jgi:hypothetical protein
MLGDATFMKAVTMVTRLTYDDPERRTVVYTSMRRILVAVAALLLLVVPVQGADVIVGPPTPGQVKVWYNSEYVICGVDVSTNTGFARIFPPDGYSPGGAWWVARVHHYHADNTFSHWEWTHAFYWDPNLPSGLGYGAWYAEQDPNLNHSVVNAIPFGSVGIEPFFWDYSTQNWIVYGSLGRLVPAD